MSGVDEGGDRPETSAMPVSDQPRNRGGQAAAEQRLRGEALTNALKHAFPEGRAGRVRVGLRADGGGLIRLLVEDDGAGMPAERRAGSLGLRLIEMFAKQVKGRAEVEAGRGGRGTAVAVTFPDPNAAAPG